MDSSEQHIKARLIYARPIQFSVENYHNARQACVVMKLGFFQQFNEIDRSQQHITPHPVHSKTIWFSNEKVGVCIVSYET